MKKRWCLQQPEENVLLNETTHLSRLAAKLLFLRGIRQPDAIAPFLHGAEATDRDPFDLKGMHAAVRRIRTAIEQKEQIIVYGDYDADGVTASALLVSALRDLGAVADVFIPDRFEHGYGLHVEAINQLAAMGACLMITVDCGIRGLEQVEHANQLGVDVVVTDHHQPGEILPDALAIIDPKQPGCTYLHKGLAGVGLAYKLAQALDKDVAERYLDFVAIGTVADLAPVVGENRDLVRKGMAQLEQSSRPGLKALMSKVGSAGQRVTSNTIGYRIGPRINAAGRIRSAGLAYALLMTEEQSQAEALADELERINRDRRDITKNIVDKALSMTDNTEETPPFVFAFDEDFNEGVVGLAASRLVERHFRPAAVGTISGEFIRASVRSIPEFNVIQALDTCAHLLERYGGHSAAAGFTVRKAKQGMLTEKLSSLAARAFGSKELLPTINIDASVSFLELDDALLDFLEALEPYGPGNPVPIFSTYGASITDRRRVGKDRQHLKFILKHDGVHREAIGFGMGDMDDQLGNVVDVVYHLERNEYRGISKPQLRMLDIKNAEA